MALQININWQQLEKIPLKTKIAALAGLSLLMAGLFFYFMYLPKQKELATLNEQLAKVQLSYNEKKAIADNLPTFQEEVRRLNERLSLALAKLPNTAEIDKVLVDVPNLAKEEELVVKVFRPGKESPKDFYAVVPLNLELAGTYNRLAKFLEKVAKLNRIISIGDITLGSGVVRPDGQVILKATVQADTYTFVDQTQKPAQGKE